MTMLAIASPCVAGDIVVTAAKVFTLTGEPLAPGAVHIRDGKIAEVAKSIKAPAGANVVDLGAGVLLPGFVDAFTTTGIEGGSAESTREVTPNFRILDAVDWSSRAFRQARSGGATTVAIVPTTENVISGLSCVAKTDGDAGKRIVSGDHSLVMALASDPASGNSARNRPDSIYSRQPTNRMGVVWILRSELARAKTAGTREMTVVCDALDGKRPVVCVSRTDADLAAILRLKQEHSIALTIAGGQESYKLKSELAAAKAPVLLAPLTTTGGAGPEATETILNLPGQLHQAGIPFALTGGKLLDQAQFAVRFGLPRDAALAAITSTPAKLLGLDKRIGTIAPGLDADLVALSGDPFDFSTVIRWTMIDGAIRAEEP